MCRPQFQDALIIFNLSLLEFDLEALALNTRYSRLNAQFLSCLEFHSHTRVFENHLAMAWKRLSAHHLGFSVSSRLFLSCRWYRGHYGHVPHTKVLHGMRIPRLDWIACRNTSQSVFVCAMSVLLNRTCFLEVLSCRVSLSSQAEERSGSRQATTPRIQNSKTNPEHFANAAWDVNFAVSLAFVKLFNPQSAIDSCLAVSQVWQIQVAMSPNECAVSEISQILKTEACLH